MICNKKALRKMCSVLLAVAVTITMLPQISVTAIAAQGDPAMNLGAGILKTGVNTAEAQTVHMADNTWRVMGYGGDGVAGSANTLALISSGNLKTKIQFRSDYEASDANHYSKSNLKSEIDAVADTFSQGEKAGIAARTLASGTFHYNEPADCVAGDPVENALLWPLSTKEASAMSNSLRMVDHLHQMDPINTWWLRSPGNQISWAGFVIGSGDVKRLGTRVSNEYGVRPAFNYNLESIVLTTAATGGKTSGAVGTDALTQVGANAEGDWKLTVNDDVHKSFAVSDVADTDSGVTVKYSGAATGANEYISAVITDKPITEEGAKTTYYGRIKNCADAGDASGTVTINTEGKIGKTDHLYVFSEQYNGDKKTDYAGQLQEVIIPHNVHDLIKTNRVAPTCTESGTEEYWTCKVCEKMFSDEEATTEITEPVTIPATGHKWSAPSYTWADDNSEVTAKRKCETCGTEEKETVKTTADVIKEANCKEAGEKKYTATFENEIFEEQTKTVELPIQPNNHEWDEGEEIQAQDICGGKGMQYTCKICGATKVEGTGEHVWETEYTIFTAPTCTEPGDEFYKCSKCDMLDLERPHVIPALGHDWGTPSYKWAEDNSSVTAERACGHDSTHAETEKVDVVKTTKDATCEEKGEITYTATFENGAFEKQTKTEEIPAIGHKWSDPLYTWSADYSEVTAERKCENCGKEEKETVKTTADVIKEANCKEKGEKKYIATFENKTFVEQTKTVELPVQPNNHDWDEGEEIEGQDICGGKGMQYTCKICGETKVEGTGQHTWETEYTRFTEPTCTEPGDEFHKCSKCDKLDLENPHVIPPLGHKWDEGKVTKEPTTTAEGIRTYTCTVCGDTKTETIPKITSTVKPVLVAKGIAKGKKAVNLSWNKVSGADRYVIYLSKCNYKGKKYTMKKVKTVNGKTFKWTKKGLKKNTAYKFYVKALKKSGKKYKTIAKSKTAHFFTSNARGKFTNPKSLKLKKSKITLKKGKSTTIKGTVTKVKKSKKLATGHAAKLRFTSNNPTVAKVNSKGKVTAKKAGTATIYVQTINGIWKTCKVTVK